MNSPREMIESLSSPRFESIAPGLSAVPGANQEAEPLAPARWNWTEVSRVLVIRLRSIGDTVLATPTLFALRRFLPQVKIDVVLEDWVAPVLAGSDLVDRVISIPPDSTSARARLARELRAERYDVVYNLHGGPTSTLLTRATGATHRVGYAHYRYARLHNHAAPQPPEIWKHSVLHSVEQQLALIGWTGVPVTDRPATRLTVEENALASATEKLARANFEGFSSGAPFAMIHPTAAFETKQWSTEKFARVCEYLEGHGLIPVAIVSNKEREVLDSLARESSAQIIGLSDLSLPEVTAVASRARLFVGNDSGIAHIAAAAGAVCVVIFGSSNIAHWRPWTTKGNSIVHSVLPCQPCHGYFCAEFEKPECILRVPIEEVTEAIDRLMKWTN